MGEPEAPGFHRERGREVREGERRQAPNSGPAPTPPPVRWLGYWGGGGEKGGVLTKQLWRFSVAKLLVSSSLGCLGAEDPRRWTHEGAVDPF